MGPDRDSNPGPLAPEARIIPLDHQAKRKKSAEMLLITIRLVLHTHYRYRIHEEERKIPTAATSPSSKHSQLQMYATYKYLFHEIV